MTTKQLYSLLEHPARQFADDAEKSKQLTIHSTNTVLCLFMHALQEIDKGNTKTMLDLALLVGLNGINLQKQ